jgi:trimeric autotransporter adhesin
VKLYFTLFLLLLSGTLDGQIITTIAGNGLEGNSGDGHQATNARIFAPSGVAADKYGRIYVVDHISNVIRKIDPNGIITRFAGNGIPGHNGDGGLATNAQIDLSYNSNGITVDTNGNVFFSDGSVIRKVSTTGLITTIAGNGIYGFSGDGGQATAASFMTPKGICFDKSGNLYVVDEENNNVRKIDMNGIISTIAGTTFGYSGDGGPATSAQLKMPLGIAADDIGNIYIADFYNNRVRKINADGIITTVAGGAISGISNCFGCLASNLALPAPIGIAIDRFGNVYTSAAGDNVIYKITADGKAYSIAGNGTPGYSGDGDAATKAILNNPNMLCFDNSGDLLIADRRNSRFRKIWYSTAHAPRVSTQLYIFPNPVPHSNFSFKIITDAIDDAKLEITNVLGQVVLRGSCSTNTNTTNTITLNTPPGLYFITAHTSAGSATSKLVIE